MKDINNLMEKFNDTYSWMLAYAEDAFFAGDTQREYHYATCARQWGQSIEYIKEMVNNKCPTCGHTCKR